jgi:hypothetical protein
MYTVNCYLFFLARSTNISAKKQRIRSWRILCFFGYGTDVKPLVSVYANLLLVLGLCLKLDLTVDQSIDGMILTETNIVTGPDGSATLTNDDVACDNGLTVCLLDTKSLGLTVAAVLGRTYTLFMSKEL